MQGGESDRDKFCRWLATLALCIYAVSLLLPAIRPGKGREYWYGWECIGALVLTFPMGLVSNPAAWANLTFAAGCYVLYRGRNRLASGLGAASLALAGSFWALAETDDPALSWLLPGYWTWMAAMGVLVFSPAIVMQLRRSVSGSPESAEPLYGLSDLNENSDSVPPA
jgi:hypothetical protein